MGRWGSVLVVGWLSVACVGRSSGAGHDARTTPSAPSANCARDLREALGESKRLRLAEAHAEAATVARVALERCGRPPEDGAEKAIELWLARSDAEHGDKRYDDARNSALTAQALLERGGRSKTPLMVGALVSLGSADLAGKNLDSAARALERATALARELRLPPTAEASATWPLASVYVQTKRARQAIPLLLRVRELVRPGTAGTTSLLRASELVLWRAYQYAGNHAATEDPLERIVALSDRPEGVGRSSPHVLDAILALASIKADSKRDAEATALWERALRLVSETPALANRRTVVVSALFGAHLERGDVDAALKVVEDARRLARDYDPASDRFETLDFTESVKDAVSKPPSPGATPAPPPKTSPAPNGNVSNAARVVAAMRSDFSRCYRNALDLDHDLTGSARLALRVDKKGVVTNVRALVIGLTTEAAECVMRRAGLGKFEPPSGGVAVVNIPVNFVKDR
jgi:tetratricopeptide (TPR) repeat protein